MYTIVVDVTQSSVTPYFGLLFWVSRWFLWYRVVMHHDERECNNCGSRQQISWYNLPRTRRTKQELLYVRCRCLLINEAFYVYVLKYARRWGCVWWWRNHQDLLQCFVLGVLEWRQNDSPILEGLLVGITHDCITVVTLLYHYCVTFFGLFHASDCGY